jgi:hypothetical protein
MAASTLCPDDVTGHPVAPHDAHRVYTRKRHAPPRQLSTPTSSHSINTMSSPFLTGYPMMN